MTANEMKFTFMLKFDAMFEFSAPNYDDRQISYLLTNAQNRVFIDKYYSLADKYKRGFESDERHRRDLEQLIKPATPTPSSVQTGVHPNGKFYDLPSDFLYAIEEAAITSAIPTKEVVVKPVTHDQYLANINNPYKRPYANLVWRMDVSRQIQAVGTGTAASAKRTELISDPTLPANTVTSYRMRYLQMPPAIVVDEFSPSNQRHCILDPIIHDAIIDEAVKMATASVKPETYQIADKEKSDN